MNKRVFCHNISVEDMQNKEKYIRTHQYIINRWKEGLRTNSNPDYPLPFPFEPPCVDGEFQCLFYWDTFFTNRGMILDGCFEYAKYNTDNLIYLLNKYGYVPNSNSFPGLKNSQPPYLQYMIRDIYEVSKDDEWLKNAYFSLKKEYDFWMTQRMTPIGLNQYLHCEKTKQDDINYYDYVCTRLPLLDKNAPEEYKVKVGRGYHAVGESGLDYSPRFHIYGTDLVEADLNAHLYSMEGYLAKLAHKFEPTIESTFINTQLKRKELMDKYLLCDDGLYYDYNFVKGCIQQRDFNFTGQFLPFIVGISSNKDAITKLLTGVEFSHGIASTGVYNYDFEYQWAYPFSWPPDNALAFWALIKLGMKKDAERVGIKYLEMCSSSFEKNHHLWECYSATYEGKAKKREYANTEMLGWTAGVYQWIYYDLFLDKKVNYE